MKLKIVHVEDFIHPDAGYQVNLLSRIQVKDGHDVSIVTSEVAKIPDFLTVFFGKNNIKERDERFFKEVGALIWACHHLICNCLILLHIL